MSDNKKVEQKEQFEGRTPGRKLSRDDLSKTMGGALIPGCCTQGCCQEPPIVIREK
ncbi:hypothetical protein P2318_03825 [Myxococcaceae bacterium GXIMD 01537]